MPKTPLYQALTSDSFLEYAFLRWILTPAVDDAVLKWITPQQKIEVLDRTYRVDYAIIGQTMKIVIELDGFTFHGDRSSFSHDRLRQNDLHTAGWLVIRFSYDSIRLDISRCISQLQSILAQDSLLATFLIDTPIIEQPDMKPIQMIPSDSPRLPIEIVDANNSYFNTIKNKLNLKTLRECQNQALVALSNYFSTDERRAACIMSVGAGKTALGVAACLTFTQRRAMIVTPSRVIRGTFDKAFDHQTLGNVLYGLQGGSLIPGCKPPKVLTLDRDDGLIRMISRNDLLKADVIITNFHSLGNGDDENDLLSKLKPDEIDFIIIDEAHIAAAESYQRAFQHFQKARSLLMSACFQRLDGKTIDAEVVYQYRLIDSIADGHAKNLRVQRFAPDVEQTTYEMIWGDGRREEIVGREALLELVKDERKLSRITAKSDVSIRQLMCIVLETLNKQTDLLCPVKPRVLFSALGERHAEQIARVANEYGIPCDYLHHSMTESKIKSVRDRFEQDSGDLQGIVQLKMLGQGYDFPPITIVVPIRPYGSFSELYQFIGRGIRILQHPALLGRVKPRDQFLDVIYHAEFGLDGHIETIYQENDMNCLTTQILPADYQAPISQLEELPGTRGNDSTNRPETFVLFERGEIDSRIVHDKKRIEQRQAEREEEALAQRYTAYVQSTPQPVLFEQFKQIVRLMDES